MLQILPAIDLRGGQCVRLKQGDYDRETVFSSNPAEMAARWVEQGAERLHLVDLDAAKAGQPINTDAVAAIVAAAGVPCQLGGGLRDDATIDRWFATGIDRGIVGTAAIKNPDWFADAARRHPGKLSLGLDARDGRVATEGWLETSGEAMLDVAARYVNLPLASIIYTNIANDGMMQGIDPGTLADLEKLAELGTPVVASGGVTTLDDIRALAAIHDRRPHLAAVIVGRALYDEAFDVREAIAATR